MSITLIGNCAMYFLKFGLRY